MSPMILNGSHFFLFQLSKWLLGIAVLITQDDHIANLEYDVPPVFIRFFRYADLGGV